MTTVIVHGTLAQGANWYAGSWHDGGFLNGLGQGMVDAAGWHDIWQMNGRDLSQSPQKTIKADGALTGHFMWHGLPDGQSRGIGAGFLALYLNKIFQQTNEPLRIIAHSHGCNVVKLASSLPELDPELYIDKAVFLACPHFYEDDYSQSQPTNWQDRFDFAKVKRRRTGIRHRYKLAPGRFGRILNVFTDSDDVQLQLAQSFSGGLAALTGGFWQNVKTQLSSGAFEQPKSTRIETDNDALHLYENLRVQMQPECGGLESHSAMHGATIARSCGRWLNSQEPVAQVLARFGHLPTINCGDNGE